MNTVKWMVGEKEGLEVAIPDSAGIPVGLGIQESLRALVEGARNRGYIGGVPIEAGVSLCLEFYDPTSGETIK
jgi:hypothetical protein